MIYYAVLLSIQVGDVISTIALPGWPHKPGKNLQGDLEDSHGHADMITELQLNNAGKIEVKLLELSVAKSKETFNKWILLDDLLNNQPWDHWSNAHQYIIRSFDFAQFDKLFK